MNPEDKTNDEIEVDVEEFENLFFEPTEEEQDLDIEVALAINSLINDYDD